MGIVKSEMVKLAEPCRVSPDAPGDGDDPAQPRVRIVEQDGTQAIVEITCACGNTFYLNCLCAAGDAMTGTDRPRCTTKENPQ